MGNIALPIFVIEGVDVSSYASVKEAEMDIEPIDAKTGGLVAYDAEGRLLRFEASQWRVQISLAEDEPQHARELEAALRQFLIAVDDPRASDPRCDLPCLIKASSTLTRTSGDIKEVLTGMWRRFIGIVRKQE